MATRLTWKPDTDSAQRAARVVALHALEGVVKAYDRLSKKDPDSIHDFRVAIRRLRSWLHLYRPALDDTLRKRTRRRLRRLAHGTTDLRDIDVQIEWLEAECTALGAERLEAARWMITALKRERKVAWRSFRKALKRDHSRVMRDLDRELSRYVVTRDVRSPEDNVTMAACTERVLHKQAESLRDALERVRSADDTRRLHRARIIAKRARYGIEELAKQAPGLSRAAEDLHRFQDIVGELRDAQLLAHRVSREVTSVAAERTAIVASELVYQPSGPMNFARAVAEPPFDASLALLFARLHDRISIAARDATAALGAIATRRLVGHVEQAAGAFGGSKPGRE